MQIFFHDRFKDCLKDFPDTVKKKLKKQISYLIKDIRHPSLHAKKYDESLDIWQARVDKNVRFYFSIDGNTYNLLEIKKHLK